MTQKKSPPIPKPRKEIRCIASTNPDEAGRNYAQTVTAPEVAAYRVFAACEQKDLTEQIDVPGLLQLLKDQSADFNKGDMRHAEAMLAAQATALQTLFVRLAERAFASQYVPNTESFLKLALRAQSQSRATLETLSALKNPPLVIAQQANLSGGAMQVNNGVAAPSRTQEIENAPNKLLEATDGKRLDTRATSAAIGGDTALEALAVRNGATHR